MGSPAGAVECAAVMVEAHKRLIRHAARAFDERDVDEVVASMHPEAEVELIGGFGDVMGQRSESSSSPG